ncbi:hypothetical protein DCAR_0105103 [Daucus carota subsp. sativus]|uniref:Uncharacterized protein n=1 Tax=Daucus carota subsp. sativus TaxID=79200 RepID=A0A162BAJ4_DAUCS|nr:PREDICTED: uncharacterized protein LOC108200122 [Daucus carota subsp. sativus]WOG85910.1 hypothetical protein DCAR_0105103 [Daucus carota subsp. sativus]
MRESRVSVAPSVAKSLATNASDHVLVIPTSKVDRSNVQQKRPNFEASRNSQKFRPRAVLSSPENDHLIGGQEMIYSKGEFETSQKKIGLPCLANFRNEAFEKKNTTVLKHKRTVGLSIEKDQAPVS